MGITGSASDFFEDTTIKIGLQGFKIFIGYFQVIVGFVPFKVDWPCSIMSAMSVL